MDKLRNGTVHTEAILNRNGRLFRLFSLGLGAQIAGRVGTCAGPFGADMVYQVMDMEYISAGEHAGQRGHQVVIHNGTLRGGGKADARRLAQFVFRDQAGRKDQAVAGDVKFRAGNGTALVVHLGYGDTFHSALALDMYDGAVVADGNIEVLQALGDIARQSAGVRHDLDHALHFGPFDDELPGHDEADVAGTQNDDLPAGQIAVQVQIALGSTGGQNARTAGPGDHQCASGAFPAAHG